MLTLGIVGNEKATGGCASTDGGFASDPWEEELDPFSLFLAIIAILSLCTCNRILCNKSWCIRKVEESQFLFMSYLSTSLDPDVSPSL